MLSLDLLTQLLCVYKYTPEWRLNLLDMGSSALDPTFIAVTKVDGELTVDATLYAVTWSNGDTSATMNTVEVCNQQTPSQIYNCFGFFLLFLFVSLSLSKYVLLNKTCISPHIFLSPFAALTLFIFRVLDYIVHRQRCQRFVSGHFASYGHCSGIQRSDCSGAA